MTVLLSGVFQLGGKYLDGLDNTRNTAAFDVIPHFEGTEDNQQKTGGEIGQGPLQGQADGQAGGTENGDKRGGLDAQLPERGNDDKSQQGDVSQVSRKTDQGGIDFCFWT